MSVYNTVFTPPPQFPNTWSLHLKQAGVIPLPALQYTKIYITPHQKVETPQGSTSEDHHSSDTFLGFEIRLETPTGDVILGDLKREPSDQKAQDVLAYIVGHSEFTAQKYERFTRFQRRSFEITPKELQCDRTQVMSEVYDMFALILKGEKMRVYSASPWDQQGWLTYERSSTKDSVHFSLPVESKTSTHKRVWSWGWSTSLFTHTSALSKPLWLSLIEEALNHSNPLSTLKNLSIDQKDQLKIPIYIHQACSL